MASADPEAPTPMLEQRLSPWLTIRTTVKPQGLVIQVARPFRERVSAVGWDRLLPEPADVTFVRSDRLWTAAVLATGGLLLSWPGLTGSAAAAAWVAAHPPLDTLSALLGPGLLGSAVLVLLLAVADPRRLSVFLDREQAVHPKLVRGGADEPQAAAFVESVRQAIVHFRCAGPPLEEAAETEAESEAGAAPASLADTLDALLTMRREGLLDDKELQRFQEFAERR